MSNVQKALYNYRNNKLFIQNSYSCLVPLTPPACVQFKVDGWKRKLLTIDGVQVSGVSFHKDKIYNKKFSFKILDKQVLAIALILRNAHKTKY